MKPIIRLALFLSLTLPFACKKSNSDSGSGAPAVDLAADVELVQNLGLLSGDMDSPLAVKGTLKIRNAQTASETKLEINGVSDDCEVYLREAEPFDGSTWNIIVIQSYNYSGGATTCERVVTLTRVSDGKTVRKTLSFNLSGEDGNTVTDSPTGDDDDDGDDPSSPSTPTTPSAPGSMEMCMGSSTPCGLRMDMTTCWAGGCYWSSMTNSCSGSATPCYVITTKSSCLAVMGCLWQ